MKSKTTEIIISAAGLTVLGAAFVCWCINTVPSAAGIGAAALSAALFAAVCLRFVPVWAEAWREPKVIGVSSDEPKHICAKIFGAILLWDVATVLLVAVLRLLLGYNPSLSFWLCTDSQHYMDIARDWYLSEGEWDRLVQLVFLPGYPLTVRAVNLIVGNYLFSGMIVSALCFAGAGCMLYKLLRLDMSHESALRGVKFLCIMPAAFFFAAPMSESLFILLSVTCIYLARRRRFLFAAAFGALAAFTRSLGIVLMVPLLFELVENRARLRQYFSLLIVPLGFAAYCVINYTVSGDFFKFMEYQSVHWNQHLGVFFNTAAYQTDYAMGSLKNNLPDFLGLWLPNLLMSFGALALMLPAVKKLRAGYSAYFLAYFIVAIGATWLLSAPRYLAATVTLPAALSVLSEKKSANLLLTLVCFALGILYLLAFAARWQVW